MIAESPQEDNPPYLKKDCTEVLHFMDNVKEYLWSLGIGEKAVLHIFQYLLIRNNVSEIHEFRDIFIYTHLFIFSQLCPFNFFRLSLIQL